MLNEEIINYTKKAIEIYPSRQIMGMEFRKRIAKVGSYGQIVKGLLNIYCIENEVSYLDTKSYLFENFIEKFNSSEEGKNFITWFGF